jgi:hypothetical protein
MYCTVTAGDNDRVDVTMHQKFLQSEDVLICV